MEFTKEGITYRSEVPIPPHRSRFTKGTKDFRDGWKQIGTFEQGHFRSGKIVRPDGWEIVGTTTRYLVRSSNSICLATTILKGILYDIHTRPHPLHVIPLTYLRTIHRVCLVGTMGDYTGIFTADHEHSCIQPFLVCDPDQHLVLPLPILTYEFIWNLGLRERYTKNGRIAYRVAPTNYGLPDSHYRILSNIIRML
jgi:hypothetical protein